MLSRLLRFALLGTLLAGLPAMASAVTPASALHPISHEAAPAPKIDAALSVASSATSLTGNVGRVPVSLPTAPAMAPVIAPPAASGTRLVTDVGPLGVRPAFSPIKILYAVADLDDPALRAAISAITGGPVDYFDARIATPTAVQLGGYNCVYTMPDFLYSDATLMGDRLADYVDAGGKVILGPFSTYDVFALQGRIRTPGYSPVTSPGSGTNHYALSSYAGDGYRSMHAGVLAYDCKFRDVLVTQGGGIVNGHYLDGEIAQAYRPDGRVVYTNGTSSAALPGTGTGDWPKLIANAAMANPGAHGMLEAPADPDDPAYRANISLLTGGVVDYYDTRGPIPSAALLHTYDCVYTWADFTFSDPTTWGDRLADRVDEGARVILGIGTTVAGFQIQGRIRTPDYCPVNNPAGTLHVASSSYVGDGTTALLAGVGPIAATFRDYLIGQGAGHVDGHTDDGEILAAYRSDGHVVFTNGTGSATFPNSGNWAQLIANACEFTPPAGRRILYAPSDVDDPGFRAKLAENTGGVVDFFNANTGTPTAVQLSNYDCVYTWANFPYSDPTTFGDRLADFVDAGGKVILGSFTTYFATPLGGRIMTPPYSPVSNPTANDHYVFDTYLGDGTTCFQHGVVTFGSQFRDFLVLQGAGIAESHYNDGEIALAYRPDRRVLYINGLYLFGTGDWARLVANGAECGDPPSVMFASNNVGQLFTLNTKTGAATFDLNLPSNATGLGATEIEFMPNGHLWVQERDGVFGGYQADPYTGGPLTAPLPTPRTYNGVEYALGRLYGAGITGGCGGSTFAVIDPSTGGEFFTLSGTGQPPLVGLAFDKRWSIMYGITSGCAGPSNLVRVDITSGQAVVLGSTGFRAGSLEFGADGDLYAGGDNTDGGNLYRVCPFFGFTRLIGPTGMGNVTGITLGVNGTVAAGPAPATLEFAAPYPNPSTSGMVQFRFSIPTASNVRLELYDVAGRLRWSESMNGLNAGPHSVTWNGLASNGTRLASGIYHMRLVTSAGDKTVRLVRFE